MKHLRTALIALAVLIPTYAIAGATRRSCCDDAGCCPGCPYCNHAK